MRSFSKVWIYFIKQPNKLQNVTLNPDGSNLECNLVGSEYLTCLVPKNHFSGKIISLLLPLLSFALNIIVL